eukprot:COSAG01_NODE_3298_length_6297_cov_68.182317_8_plen_78_part_00
MSRLFLSKNIEDGNGRAGDRGVHHRRPSLCAHPDLTCHRVGAPSCRETAASSSSSASLGESADGRAVWWWGGVAPLN